MSRRVLLVRHPAVADSLNGLCYGSSDVPLRDARPAQLDAIAAVVARSGPFTHLYSSDLCRCTALAEVLSGRIGIPPLTDRRPRERCFGTWEGRPLDDIHAETGDAMLGMLTDPVGWRPPGGETTYELRDRVLGWYAELPPAGHIVAITHGGPIAALRGELGGRPVGEWPSLVPTHGEIVTIGIGQNPPAM
jgi:broad specificity phosphatase PhoE